MTGKIERSLEELYRDEITRQDIEEEAERLEKLEHGLFHDLSDYAIPPYLSIKGAVLYNTDWVLEEYEYGGTVETEKIELPTLIQVWRKIVIP